MYLFGFISKAYFKYVVEGNNPGSEKWSQMPGVRNLHKDTQ